MPARLEKLSKPSARLIAVAAQGFDKPRPQRKGSQTHLKKLFAQIGTVQIDSVNVLVRSQELPLLARLGNHDRQLLPKATEQKIIFEYWGHEASYLPVEYQPLFRWKMEAARNAKYQFWALSRFYEENKKFVDQVHKRIIADGPLTASQLSTRTQKKKSWWDWDDSKMALEFLFLSGQIMSRSRGSDFAKNYDITERVLPPSIINLPTPNEHDARKKLVLIAAKAMGVATMADLADYFRQKLVAVKTIIKELVEEKSLLEVKVEGWQDRAFLFPNSKMPKQITASALLSPFDSLVWFRPRNERLFDFHYRIEIYTPREKRKFGYYVLPFMCNGEVVGRVDLKADRKNSKLLVNGAFAESGQSIKKVVPDLASELRLMARWLELDGIEIAPRGELAEQLGRIL